MNVTPYFLLMFLCLFEKSLAYNSSESVQLEGSAEKDRLSYLHTIEQDLLKHSWEKLEDPCLIQLIKVIRNVQNSTLWATWIWDSMQFPVGQLYGSRNHLGNFDQCLHLPWKDRLELKTQYCLAELNLSEIDPEVTNVDLFDSVHKYIRYKTKHSLRYNSLIWGICAPAICKAESLSKFVKAMFRSTHLGQIETQVNISVNSAFCQVAGELEDNKLTEYVFMTFALSLMVVTLICTFYVNFNQHAVTCSNKLRDFVKAFDLKTNAESAIKVEDQSIRSILGIRFISIYLIYTGHYWVVKNVVGTSNAGEQDKMLDNPIQCIIYNVDMLVDIFFMLSGLLTAKNLLERKHKSFSPLTLIARRYIRLTCSILVIILVQPIVLLRGDLGPLVKKHLQFEVDMCNNNCWKIVLMVGNYGDTENMCYPILWSVICEFHLFIIGILIFCIYRKNRTVGIAAYCICAAASIVLPVIHNYVHNSPAAISFDFKLTDNARKILIGDPAYVNTHLRAGPYFLGIALGYLMVFYHPDRHRNVMSKISTISAFVVWAALLASHLTVSMLYHVREYGPWEGAVFSVLRRIIMATLAASLIILCEYGNLPSLTAAFGWSGFVPLGKLSYGMFLTHYMLILRFVSRTRVPLRSNLLDDFYATFGLLAVTMALSFLMWLFWDAPVINLFEVLLKRFRNKTEQIGSTGDKCDEKLEAAATENEKYVSNNLEKKIN